MCLNTFDGQCETTLSVYFIIPSKVPKIGRETRYHCGSTENLVMYHTVCLFRAITVSKAEYIRCISSGLLPVLSLLVSVGPNVRSQFWPIRSRRPRGSLYVNKTLTEFCYRILAARWTRRVWSEADTLRRACYLSILRLSGGSHQQKL